MIAFARIWNILPAFDRRNTNPSQDYGIHGCELRMILVGPLGATQFVLFTNWQLPHVNQELQHKTLPLMLGDSHVLCRPIPVDRGYHWKTPRYEGQTSRECEYVKGLCYYDGSGLNAQRTYQLLLSGGSDAVWKDLEEYYLEIAGLK